MKWTRTVVCRVCSDARVRATTQGTEACVICGATALPTPRAYEKWLWERLDETEERPLNAAGEPMSPLDLDDDELALYRRWQRDYPHASKTRLLKWLEGRRYDPSKDAEFRAEADALLAKGWHLGEPLP